MKKITTHYMYLYTKYNYTNAYFIDRGFTVFLILEYIYKKIFDLWDYRNKTKKKIAMVRFFHINHFSLYWFQQALVGIAYSFGFIIGPVIGAVFAKRSSLESGNPYLLPALFAITLTVADILFVYLCLKETLPKEKRVNKWFR